MRFTLLERRTKMIADLWLTALVHVDAFRFAPTAYLTAAKWWLKRKRVRARGQMAPLLSQSSRAYMLWALRQERAGRVHSPPDMTPSIIALVDRGTGQGTDERALAATLRSLEAEGVPALVIGAGADTAATAATIDRSGNPWLMPITVGDCVAPGTVAGYRVAMAANPGAWLLYADDDLVGRWGRRMSPHFKPDWNSELFRHHDYLTGACIVRADRAALAAVAGKPDWAQRLVTRRIEAGAGQGAPVHVRQMLHHRAARIAPCAILLPLACPVDLPPLTVIVPTRNRLDLLRNCLDGVAATDYPDVHVIVVDNDSDDPETLAYLAALDPARASVLRHAGPFNYSAINNRAAAQAKGRLLCLLNNDIEVTAPDWLAIMATQALREDVGAVGARLLYPDGRIQHAGVVIGVGNAAGHAHRFIRPAEEGYFRRHALPQYISAVTAACLVVQRDRFMAVGGLNERDFPVAFNDVDLCLRLNQRGWQSLYEPRATLIHHESVSRGLDQDPIGAARFASELAALKRFWKTDEIVDPYHHPSLSRASEQFAVALS